MWHLWKHQEVSDGANPNGFKFQSSTSCWWEVGGLGCTCRVFFALLRDLSDPSEGGWNLLFLQNEVTAQQLDSGGKGPWGGLETPLVTVM